MLSPWEKLRNRSSVIAVERLTRPVSRNQAKGEEHWGK
jgi:hypothetical protein